MTMSESPFSEDRELLAGASGDPDAFAAFYRRHVRTILAYVTRQVGANEAGDVVAEVFATALVHRRRFDPARGNAEAWLIGIARHKIADAARRGAVEARMCRRLGVRLPADGVAEPDLDDGRELLSRLAPEQRRAVEARVIADQSYAEIARRESVSEQVVRKRVSRALATLRSRFQEEP
jgi:RNA polymerase sigma-70 factor (ECF subfamily)